MANTEQPRLELVGLSADYFASNPDVDKLLVVVGTKVFYRPERETLATHEAAVAETSVMTIHRHEAEGTTPDQSSLVDVEGSVINLEFPASVGAVELILASIKMMGETPRKMAELIYLAILQVAGNRAAAATEMEWVEEYLMDLMAQGLSTVTYTPENNEFLALEIAKPAGLEDLLEGALHLPGVLADADADATPTADEAATTETAATEAATAEAAVTEKPAAPKAVKVVKDVTKKTATTPKASK